MKTDIKQLQVLAATGRQLMVEALVKAGCGHAGGSLSSFDILTALYCRVLNVDPAVPHDPGRDYFILSKGHSAIGLYTALHLKGFISRDELMTFRADGSNLCGHPVADKVPGVEMSTGALGHGLGAGCGIALALKKDNKPNRVYVLLGDGELNEGSVWEALMFAGHYGLDNLTAIIDRNGLATDADTETLMRIEPLCGKLTAFNWQLREIDGHDMQALVSTLEETPFKPGKPSVIVARTTKGKGISVMENTLASHGGGIPKDLIDAARHDTALALQRLSHG
jgi:transketolase